MLAVSLNNTLTLPWSPAPSIGNKGFTPLSSPAVGTKGDLATWWGGGGGGISPWVPTVEDGKTKPSYDVDLLGASVDYTLPPVPGYNTRQWVPHRDLQA